MTNERTNSRVAYELIKKYPGSGELGDIVECSKVPGHQWPEYYRAIYTLEMHLRDKRAALVKQLIDLDHQIEDAMKQPNT